MLVVNFFLVRTFDYLTFILFAHHTLNKHFEMFFSMSGLILSRCYFDVNDVWCNRGDGYFNFEEIFSDHNLDHTK